MVGGHTGGDGDRAAIQQARRPGLGRGSRAGGVPSRLRRGGRRRPGRRADHDRGADGNGCDAGLRPHARADRGPVLPRPRPRPARHHRGPAGCRRSTSPSRSSTRIPAPRSPSAAVDVWHCDAGGGYSGGQGDSGTFLRGIQATGDDGLAEFATVYPGLVPGPGGAHPCEGARRRRRGAHGPALLRRRLQRIRLRGRAVCRPRRARHAERLRLDLAQSEGSTIVSVERAGDGYAGAVTLGVRAT